MGRINDIVFPNRTYGDDVMDLNHPGEFQAIGLFEIESADFSGGAIGLKAFLPGFPVSFVLI
jgi:hypothetical protein